MNQITTLLGLMKVPSETSDKWLEKAGADDWTEMDTETIGKCIQYLTEKLPRANAAA